MTRRASPAAALLPVICVLTAPAACGLLEPLPGVTPGAGGRPDFEAGGSDAGRIARAGSGASQAGSPVAPGPESGGEGSDRPPCAAGGATSRGQGDPPSSGGEDWNAGGTANGGIDNSIQPTDGGARAGQGGVPNAHSGGATAKAGAAGAGGALGTGAGGALGTGGCDAEHPNCQSIAGLIYDAEGCAPAQPARSTMDCDEQPLYELCPLGAARIRGHVECYDPKDWLVSLAAKPRTNGGTALCFLSTKQASNSPWAPVMDFVLGPDESRASFDASGFSGIQFDYTGPTPLQVYVTINEPCERPEPCSFQCQDPPKPTTEWKTAKLSFDDFARGSEILIKRTNVQTVQITTGRDEEVLDFCIDNVRFYP